MVGDLPVTLAKRRRNGCNHLDFRVSVSKCGCPAITPRHSAASRLAAEIAAFVTGTDDRLEAEKMTVRSNNVGPIFGHDEMSPQVVDDRAYSAPKPFRNDDDGGRVAVERLITQCID